MEGKKQKQLFTHNCCFNESDSKQTNQVAPSTSGEKRRLTKPVTGLQRHDDWQLLLRLRHTTTSNSSSSSQSSGRTLQVVATGYSYNEPGLGCYTATRIDLRKSNRRAVDPSVIPLGSLIEVLVMALQLLGILVVR